MCVKVSKLRSSLRSNPLAQKRIKEYSSSGAELNDDQKRSVAILPGLEAVVKELEEVKKAIEVRRPTYCLRFSQAIDRDLRYRYTNPNSRKRSQPRGLQQMRPRKPRLRRPSWRQRFGAWLQPTTFTLLTRLPGCGRNHRQTCPLLRPFINPGQQLASARPQCRVDRNGVACDHLGGRNSDRGGIAVKRGYYFWSLLWGR